MEITRSMLKVVKLICERASKEAYRHNLDIFFLVGFFGLLCIPI